MQTRAPIVVAEDAYGWVGRGRGVLAPSLRSLTVLRVPAAWCGRLGRFGGVAWCGAVGSVRRRGDACDVRVLSGRARCGDGDVAGAAAMLLGDALDLRQRRPMAVPEAAGAVRLPTCGGKRTLDLPHAVRLPTCGGKRRLDLPHAVRLPTCGGKRRLDLPHAVRLLPGRDASTRPPEGSDAQVESHLSVGSFCTTPQQQARGALAASQAL